jgi:Trk K+ transport system NAD-binding subunit
VEPLGHRLEVAEVRVHDQSPLASKTLAESGIDAGTGVHVVGQWKSDALTSPPTADQKLEPGMILVAAGSPDSIKALGEIVRPITPEGTIVVAGYGDVGSKLVEMLHDAGERVCVIDPTEQAGVDVVGDVLDRDMLIAAKVAQARVVILAPENDSAALLAAAVVRDFAPDVPIIACAALEESVERIHQAGADFVLSVSQVAGQILAHHILGEMVFQQSRIKLSKLKVSRLSGQRDLLSGIREQTGCTVIAVERAGEVMMDITPSFELSEDDALYVCGTLDAFNRFHEQFSESPA